MEICSRFTGMERKDGAFLLHTDNADVKVCFVTDEIVRVRASFDHELAEESYILMTTAWEDRMDDLFKGERTRVEPFAAEVTEDDKTITFATGKVTLVVEKDPINFKLLSADGSELYSTLPGNPFVKDSNNRVVAYSRMKEDDCFYGFGEKTGELDKNKTFQRERATDAMGYDAEKMDTLYKHIWTVTPKRLSACSTTTSTSPCSTWAARRATTGPATPTSRPTVAIWTAS